MNRATQGQPRAGRAGRHAVTLAAGMLLAGAVLAGCSAVKPVLGTGEPQVTQVNPADFAGQPVASAQPAPTPPAIEGLDGPVGPPVLGAGMPINDRARLAPTAAFDTPIEGPVVLDGMIGQINGQAVYADDLLRDVEPELRALAKRVPEGEFRQRSRELLMGKVRGKLIDALILAEAERNLTEREQAGLRYFMQNKREELLRKHGRGSLAVAERNLLADTGLTLDQTLREERNRLVTETYIRRNILAKVNVAKRDIERYYRDNEQQFNPPPTRDLRLIVVSDADQAAAVKQRLDANESFEQLASDPSNIFAGSDLLSGLKGYQPTGRAAVDDAVAPLEQGQWVGPIAVEGRYWFVRVEALDRPEGIPLLEAQRRIETTLRERQFIQLRQQFVDRLLKEGSYNPPEQMADALVQIAVNRYLRGS